MSDKLFEYKDPQDWYIAQWGEDADYNQFSQCLRKLPLC